MKIVKPSVKLLGVMYPKLYNEEIDDCLVVFDPQKLIEVAGRVCYKSEDRITSNSSAAFVEMLKGNGHLAMIEHSCASFHVVTDIAVGRECTRHRIMSFAQECVSGDTKLTKSVTIKQLFEKQKRRRKLPLIKSVGFGRVIPNWVIEVFYKGRCEVYEMKTSSGYSIKTTLAHEFQTEDCSFKRLEDLKIGDIVITNGRSCLLKIDDEKLKDLYINEHFSPKEIAVMYDAPYVSILRRLHIIGIFEKHLNDKDKQKYSFNHDDKTREKMRAKIIDGYKNGRIVWNKGLDETNMSVKKQADALRENHHDNEIGELNSMWKGGPHGHGLAKLKKKDINHCEICGDVYGLEVHHKDRNTENNLDENLIKLCSSCHSRVHDGWYVGITTHPDIITSITKVGVEDVYDLQMEEPFHNYVANGFVVHNSTRYCNYGKEKFGGELTVIEPPFLDEVTRAAWESSVLVAEAAYMKMIERGAKPEIARSVLPLCTKTELVMTANFREWMHFIKLRTDEAHAHPQMVEIAKMIEEELIELAPAVFGGKR